MTFQEIFSRVFSASEGTRPSPKVHPQELALVFILLAQGTLFSLELPLNDPAAEDWLHLSERALVKGNFFANNTIPGVQTLVSLHCIYPIGNIFISASDGALSHVSGRACVTLR